MRVWFSKSSSTQMVRASPRQVLMAPPKCGMRIQERNFLPYLVIPVLYLTLDLAGMANILLPLAWIKRPKYGMLLRAKNYLHSMPQPHLRVWLLARMAHNWQLAAVTAPLGFISCILKI